MRGKVNTRRLKVIVYLFFSCQVQFLNSYYSNVNNIFFDKTRHKLVHMYMYMYTNQQHVLNLCNRHETISMYIFLDCLPGYYKTNCSDPCRYPNYGLRCQKECNCPEKSCHHVFGCPDHKLDGKISLRKKTRKRNIYKYLQRLEQIETHSLESYFDYE